MLCYYKDEIWFFKVYTVTLVVIVSMVIEGVISSAVLSTEN